MRGFERAPESFAEFWPGYVGEHRRPACRAAHYVGGVAAIAAAGWALWHGGPWWLLLVPVVGYGCAWFGHLAFEGNRPATLRFPWWSLRGELAMLWLGLTGRMRVEVERLFGTAAPGPDAPLLRER